MVRLPEPPGADAPEAGATGDSQFSKLMRVYQVQAHRKARLEAELKDTKSVLENAKELIRSEVGTIGLAKGSVMRVDGIGKFNYTTNRYYSVPPENRAEFVELIIERGEQSLLEMGKKSLNDWCKAIVDDYDAEVPGSFELPNYIRFFEDTMVPNIVAVKEET